MTEQPCDTIWCTNPGVYPVYYGSDIQAWLCTRHAGGVVV